VAEDNSLVEEDTPILPRDWPPYVTQFDRGQSSLLQLSN